MLKKFTTRFTRKNRSDNIPVVAASRDLASTERHLQQRVTAGAANAADRDAASHLLGSDLDARDFFFELILSDAEFNQ